MSVATTSSGTQVSWPLSSTDSANEILGVNYRERVKQQTSLGEYITDLAVMMQYGRRASPYVFFLGGVPVLDWLIKFIPGPLKGVCESVMTVIKITPLFLGMKNECFRHLESGETRYVVSAKSFSGIGLVALKYDKNGFLETDSNGALSVILTSDKTTNVFSSILSYFIGGKKSFCIQYILQISALFNATRDIPTSIFFDHYQWKAYKLKKIGKEERQKRLAKLDLIDQRLGTTYRKSIVKNSAYYCTFNMLSKQLETAKAQSEIMGLPACCKCPTPHSFEWGELLRLLLGKGECPAGGQSLNPREVVFNAGLFDEMNAPIHNHSHQ